MMKKIINKTRVFFPNGEYEILAKIGGTIGVGHAVSRAGRFIFFVSLGH